MDTSWVSPVVWATMLVIKCHQVGVASQSSAVLDFHLPIMLWRRCGTTNKQILDDLSTSTRNVARCPMYQVSGQHACSAFVAASFLNGLRASFNARHWTLVRGSPAFSCLTPHRP